MFSLLIDWFIPSKAKNLSRALLSRLIGFTRVDSWNTALAKSIGYESSSVVGPVIEAARQLRNDCQEAALATSRYHQVASGMLCCIAQYDLKKNQPIRVLDFGGGSADYFFQFEKFVPHISFEWTVLETPALAEAMQRDLGHDHANLRWVDSFEKTSESYDVVLCSSVLQYVEKPFEVLDQLVKKSQFLILNRLPLVDTAEHFVAVQRIVTKRKRGSYPAHFFSESKFMQDLSQYGLIPMRWMVPEDQPVINWKAQPNQGLVLQTKLTQQEA
jgi:putative methyltransferase (TIGR04325 family)